MRKVEMKEHGQADKPLRDLLEIIYFTEMVTAKIHGKKDEAEIYRTVKEEFEKSRRYNVSILLLTGDGKKLEIAETSITPGKLRAGEKASGLKLAGYKIDLNKSSIYSKVVREEKTIHVNASDIIRELVPEPLAPQVSKITGYEQKPAILTPLKRYGKTIGVLAVSSTSPAEHFIPSVKNLAQHVSNALELIARARERRQVEELHRNVVDLSPDSIITVDTKGVITSCNAAATRMLGYSKDEMVGKHFSKIGVLRVVDIPKYLKLFWSVLRGRITKPLELTFYNKDGTPFLAEVRVGLLKEGGKTTGLQAISRDITERNRAEKALKESEQKLRDIIDTSPDAIVWTDNAGNVTLVNRKGLELTGYPKKALMGKNFMDVEALSPESKERILESFMKRIQGVDTPPYEVEIVAKNGEVIPAELSASAIREGDKIVGTQSIFRDLRERKKMEEKLREYADHLEDMVEQRTGELRKAQERFLKSERLAAIGEVATMVGHDLRNPLQSIENATYYLSNELPRLPITTPIPKKAVEMLQVINDSVNYADQIIRDLYDFSSAKKPVVKRIDINTIVSKALSQVKAPENVDLITELCPLPESEVDKDMMERVFLNLAVNGVQAMEGNGGKLKVATRVEKGFVEVSFRDTGVGIPRENMTKLFTPFFTTKAKGMGVGLAICKRFVDNHGGSITVESVEGRGSIFKVKLPIQQKKEVKTSGNEQTKHPYS